MLPFLTILMWLDIIVDIFSQILNKFGLLSSAFTTPSSNANLYQPNDRSIHCWDLEIFTSPQETFSFSKDFRLGFFHFVKQSTRKRRHTFSQFQL